jgi:hypothetical protein
MPGSLKVSSSSLAPLSDADGPRSRGASMHGDNRAGGNPAVLKGIAAGAAVVILAGIAVLALARGPSAAEQPPGSAGAPEPGPSVQPSQVAPTPDVAPTQAAATSPASTDPAPVKTSAAGPEDVSPTGTRPTTKPAVPGAVPPTKPTASGKKKNWGF